MRSAQIAANRKETNDAAEIILMGKARDFTAERHRAHLYIRGAHFKSANLKIGHYIREIIGGGSMLIGEGSQPGTREKSKNIRRNHDRTHGVPGEKLFCWARRLRIPATAGAAAGEDTLCDCGAGRICGR